MLDQQSFERGLEIGLLTARVILRDHQSLHLARREVECHIGEIKSAMEERWEGKRKMTWDDIYFRVPLATAADFGLAPPLSD